MIDPSAVLSNQQFSIEKFLWEFLAQPAGELLINRDDIATRITELEETGHAVIWHLGFGSRAKFGQLTLYVGATYINDPGNVKLLALLDKVNECLYGNTSITVFNYVDGSPTDKVNEMVIVGPVSSWPQVTEPNKFKTKTLSVKLKFGQLRN